MFNHVLKADLEDLLLDSTLLQYADDLLIGSSSLEQCQRFYQGTEHWLLQITQNHFICMWLIEYMDLLQQY